MSKWFTVRQVCPVCESSNNTTLLKLAYAESPIKDLLDSWYSYDYNALEGSYYILEECESCGLIYQREILNEQATAKLYNEWINYEKGFERNVNERTSDRGIARAQELANVMMYLDKTPGKLNVLDFGMGFGTWCYLVKGFGCHNVHGTEMSQARIGYAGDVNILDWKDLPNYQFDFINTEQVFEHLADPAGTLDYLKQALAPNGIIKISVPNGADIKRRLKMRDWGAFKDPKNSAESIAMWEDGSKSSLNAVAPLEHINCFNYSVLVEMAKRVGFVQALIPNKRIVVHTDKFKVKNILRPYYHLLSNLLPFLKIKPRNKTSLFFKVSPR